MRGQMKWVLAIAFASAIPVWGQCDWSPYFDQMDNPPAYQELQSERAQGWPNLDPARNGGITLQQAMAQSDQIMAQTRQQMQQAYQAWEQTRGSNTQSINVTYAQCQNAGSANMAAACQYHVLQSQLLSMEGLSDVMRCRAGMPAGTYGAMPVGGMGSGASDTSRTGGSSSFESGANSMNDINVSKRGGMVSSALHNWQPPAQQQAAQASLAQNTALADPFADTGGSAGGAGGTANASSDDSFSAGPNNNASGDSQWSDPLAGGPAQGADEATPPSAAPAPPTRAEITAALDTGTATVGASEISVTPVAQVSAGPGWNQFVAPAADPISAASSNAPSDFTNMASTAQGDNPSPSAPPSPDATDRLIDNAVTTVDETLEYTPKAVALIRNAGEPLSVVIEEVADADAGLPISPTAPAPMFHQENRLLDDVNAASQNLFDSSGNAAPAPQVLDRLNYDSGEGLNKAMVDTIENAAPPLKYIDSLNQDLTRITNFATKKVNSLSCMFSFDPYCK